MRYALLLHYGEPAPGELSEETMAEGQAAFAAYARSLEEAGILRGADILAQSHATTTVSLRTGAPQVQDGPFVEAKEMLAGVFIIEVPHLDAAIAWAEKCPAARFGAVEIRPVAVTVVNGDWQTPNADATAWAEQK